MASRQQLERALVGADRAGDVQAATMLANAIKNGQYDDAPDAQTSQQQQPGISAAPDIPPVPGGQWMDENAGEIMGANVQGQPLPEGNGIAQYANDEIKGLLNVPGVDIAAELIAGANRGGVKLIDYVGPDFANMLLREVGVDFQLPRLQDSEFVQQGIQGNYMEPGTARDIVRTGGEFALPGTAAGNVLRTAAKTIPKVGVSELGTTQRVVQQMGVGSPAGDLALSAVSGGGAEVGEDIGGTTGALVGALTAPMAAVGLKKLFGGMLNMGKGAWESIGKSVTEQADAGAAEALADAMIRSGLTPKQVTDRLKTLGKKGMPADISTNFARLLRTASNMIPQIEGKAGKVFAERQKGQSERITKSLDEAGGYGGKTVEDEIERMDKILKPQIDKLYKDAGVQGIRYSENLKKLLYGDSSVGKARVIAEQELVNKRALGEKVTSLSEIDATKRELDDQINRAIKQEQMNKAMDLVRMKNIIVEEADKAIPVYKEARNLYAGKKEMENAADLGEQILRTKTREVQQLTKSLSKSEKNMYKLGAKRAILDTIDTVNINADLVKRLFGKNGDVKKLRVLFSNNKDFNKFQKDLRREADFILTRNKAQGNSTTAQQLNDAQKAADDMIFGAMAPTMQAAMMISRLAGKKGAAATNKAYEQIGEILINSGMDKAKLESLLEKGAFRIIERELRKVLRSTAAPIRTSGIRGGAVETTREQGQ